MLSGDNVAEGCYDWERMSAAHYMRHHFYWVRTQYLAPLDHFRNIQASIAFFNPTHIAVSPAKPTCQLPLRHACFLPDPH
jgi:hypothetical protein